MAAGGKRSAKKDPSLLEVGSRVRVDFKLQMYNSTASLNGELGILEGVGTLDCGVVILLVRIDRNSKAYWFRPEDIKNLTDMKSVV